MASLRYGQVRGGLQFDPGLRDPGSAIQHQQVHVVFQGEGNRLCQAARTDTHSQQLVCTQALHGPAFNIGSNHIDQSVGGCISVICFVDQLQPVDRLGFGIAMGCPGKWPAAEIGATRIGQTRLRVLCIWTPGRGRSR
jgi:hypothetical protein